ncbi:SIR2-like domain-containing protein [Leptodontidium sp. MPI-SDFR-AT-0119]|nr:SIR2-like domain-containing protein [Leptodontidium sp. MPI-SDFR-AT-0119]
MDPPWIQNEAAKEAARRQEETLARLRNDLKNHRLAIITGAGVTLNVTADTSGEPLSRITWTGLMRNGLDYLVNEGYVDRSNRRTSRAYEALEDPETDGLLDAANILSSQMKQQGQFPTWLESVFGSLSQETRHPDLLDMLKALHERGATLLTTNYDDVLEKYCGLQRVGRSNQDEVSRFQRGDLNGVFHIHGSYCDPHEVVLDTTDYYDVKHSDGVQDVLKTFLQYKTILFVGCGSGLEDPNFDALLRWASERHKNIPHRHCLLIRDGDSVKYQPLVRVK